MYVVCLCHVYNYVTCVISDKFPIFSLAFGGGAELPFLAKLSLQNDGLARQIYLDSDPELQLQGFYK